MPRKSRKKKPPSDLTPQPWAGETRLTLRREKMNLTKEQIEAIRDGKLAVNEARQIALCTLALRGLENQWRPIETAPKDGTECFIFREGWPCALLAKWVAYPGNPVEDDNGNAFNMRGWLFDELSFMPGNEDGWIGWSDDEMPTIWAEMPLPSPPEGK